MIITKLGFLTIQTSDVGPHLSYLPGLEASTSTIYVILAAQQLWLDVILSCIILKYWIDSSFSLFVLIYDISSSKFDDWRRAFTEIN